MPSTLTRIMREIEAGLLLRAGINPEPHVGQDIANRADDRYTQVGLSVLEASREVLDICGLPSHNLDSASTIEAAFSGGGVGAIFDRVLNAAVVEPFRSGDSTLGWVTEVEVTDFKSNIRIRREQVEQMKLLPRGGTAEDLQVEFATSESYRAHRFARRFTVDAQDLLNDDVQALTEPGRLFGTASLRLKRDLVYSVLLANGALSDSVAMFHADHSNLLTGAALSAATLDAGIAAMENLQENSQSVDVSPRFLVVPPELRGLALRLNRDMVNPLVVRSDSRLSNGVVDPVDATTYAGSATSWYLSASSGPVEFGFIGSRLPTIRSEVLTQGAFGVSFGINFDVGSVASGFNGVQKSTA